MDPGLKSLSRECLATTFHFPEVAVNQRTSGVLDVEAKTPEFKVTAAAIAPGSGGEKSDPS